MRGEGGPGRGMVGRGIGGKGEGESVRGEGGGKNRKKNKKNRKNKEEDLFSSYVCLAENADVVQYCDCREPQPFLGFTS